MYDATLRASEVGVSLHVMPRPKPAIPLVGFNVRLPANEAEALTRIVPRWHAAYAAELAKRGFHLPPAPDKTAWLRAMIRAEAERYGIPIDDAGTAPEPVSPPQKPRPTPQKKR